MRFRCAAAFALVCLSYPSGAPAQETPDGTAVAVRYSLKSSLLVSRWPGDAALFPDRNSATGFWRFRVEPTLQWSDRLAVDLAFEQRVRLFSSTSSVSGDTILPSNATAPFRVRQMDWRFASASNADWGGEIDRAALRVRFPRADITLGRQAIGWGRGALFSAVDLFAPFTPLEADREWRRGVDAIRSDVRLSDRVSLDAVAAFGSTLNGSTVASRLRGYAGKADLEILAGYRAGDLFAGVTSSAAIGDFEAHGELALFRTDSVPGSLMFDAQRLIPKVVGGGSYRVPVGSGVLVYGEYHYSGFGALTADQIVPNLRDPAFQNRYLRGDTQILGRHATAVLASYELSPEFAISTEWIQSPSDGSGVLVPSTTWTLNDRWSMLFSGYVPYGGGPTGGGLNSQFGMSPIAMFLQVRVYR